MNIQGYNVNVVRTMLPWGGSGWMAVLDFIRPGLRAYGELRCEAVKGANRDIDEWNRMKNYDESSSES